MSHVIINENNEAFLVVPSKKHGELRARIDAADADLVARFTWRRSDRQNGQTYICTHKENRSPLYLHRLITGAPAGVEVDHINIDALDNRRCNLRLTSRSENNRNVRKRRNNVSGYKGVHWSAERSCWRAYGELGGKRVWIGRFDDVHEAGRAAASWRAVNYPTSPEARA